MRRLAHVSTSAKHLLKSRLSGAFVILLGSRIFGIVRELIVSIAFGFSAITDLFYQATFSLTALLTVTNGPFTTAFAARLNQADQRNHQAHIAYYSQFTARLGMVLGFCYAVSALFLFLRPGIVVQYGWTGVLVLVPCAMQLTVVGFSGAVANAVGEITEGAKLMFLLNAAFVGCVAVFWLSHAPLAGWTLPLCYTIGCAVAFAWSRKVMQGLAARHSEGIGHGTVPLPLPGLGTSFMFAGSETMVFVFTQFLIVALATSTGPGWVSGASLAHRLCFSVNGLIISPFASLLMLDVMRRNANSRIFLKGVAACAIGLTLLAMVLALGAPLALHLFAYKLHGSTPAILSQILPAYAIWMIPMGVNVVVCRVMFGLKMDRIYTFATIGSYLIANALRAFIGLYLKNFTMALMAGALVEIVCVLTLIIVTIRHMTRQLTTGSIA